LSPTISLCLIPLLGGVLSGQVPGKIFDPDKPADMKILGEKLRTHIAHVIISIHSEADPDALDRDGFGIVLGDHRVAMNTYLLEDVKGVKIEGPRSKPLPAKIIVFDKKHRVAILETQSRLSNIGLVPAKISPSKRWLPGMPVFALERTTGEPVVISGVLTDYSKTGRKQHRPRINWVLSHGRPVFDPVGDFVGYAYETRFDHKAGILVSYDQIKAAESSKKNSK
jgi:hypothetical protein